MPSGTRNYPIIGEHLWSLFYSVYWILLLFFVCVLLNKFVIHLSYLCVLICGPVGQVPHICRVTHVVYYYYGL